MNNEHEERYAGRGTCWWCGGQLCWDNDFNSDDVYQDGSDRLVTFLHCTNPKCGAKITYEEPEDESE